MYCRKCYRDLSDVTDGLCPDCRTEFNRFNPRTYAARPFPSKVRIAFHIVATSLIGLAVAWVVAFHQMMIHSGH